ncbi:MAG: DUF5107 domain-containing protein [Mucilaginibacter polytrichastri]|nr:DUF5107 domain-containing protein [Mucilaginibacter polytrichastri]
MQKHFATVREETVIIPTYGTGKPDKNPMFFEKRVYQGSSGVVYPNPVIEKIEDEKEERAYTGLYLENAYLEVLILPELGGRIQTAYDKIAGRHFIYHNQVIKPALVGLTGPWISGGIEFNWPQHHRPSTFDPVDYRIAENADGSCTVWINEIERMFHTQATVAFTVYPDKAYIEIRARLFNRTELPQTFLWWANPAVKVNDDYQSVFPPDVHAVFDHGKRDVSGFPIATGTYYKVDYAPGTDISMYRNIPVPTSYMAVASQYDFMGGYEHDTRAGLLHVANHHVSPGKKQWTWGHGDFGQAWDRNLTDQDGPYIELMTGVYTDNQPDFTWLMPYEEKSFTQYFLPYRELGLVKNANQDLLLTLKKEGEKGILVQVFGTSVQPGLELLVAAADREIARVKFTADPEHVFSYLIGEENDHEDQLTFYIRSGEKQLLRYAPADNRQKELPEPAKPALSPQDTKTGEDLFLTGQHLEQYRHATYDPVPYYEEALRRDPADIRNNNALGKWYLRRGQFAKSEPYFRKAIETATKRNPNPYDSEPYYHLGVCLKHLDRPDEAYDAFYKSTWSNAWKDAGYFSVAQLDIFRGETGLAIGHLELSLERNTRNTKAQVLYCAALRLDQRPEQALKAADRFLEKNAFNLGAYFEKARALELLHRDDEAEDAIRQLRELSRLNEHTFAENAFDYAEAGLYTDAIGLFSLLKKERSLSAIGQYTLGWLYDRSGDPEAAAAAFAMAKNTDPYLCFPNRLNEIHVLRKAMSYDAKDARAPYLLGNLFYDRRQYTEAISLWERSAQLDRQFPTVWRNLGIAAYNKQNDPQKALACYEHAFALDTSDARVLMELDQLRKRLNHPAEERFAFLERYPETVRERDDLYLEHIALLNFAGNYTEALELLLARKFHPWEGGEGKVSGQYVFALVQLAKNQLEQSGYSQAIALLNEAKVYPHNLGEGKLPGARENDLEYWTAVACEAMGDEASAKHYFERAAQGDAEPAAAIFYNDQQPDQIFYQGLALKKQGEKGRAEAIFRNLLAYGRAHIADRIKMDYFAVSLPNMLIFDDDLDLRNRIHCLYMQGLGHLGLDEQEQALHCFDEAAALDVHHPGISVHAKMARTARHLAG